MTCTLVVSPNLVAYVDDEDAALLRRYSWTKTERPHTTYAVTWIDGASVYLHRLILNYFDEEDVDHKNGNGLDCRKSNLRIVSKTINQLNRVDAAGVTERQLVGGSVYEARIRYDGVLTHLGRFKTYDVAKRVADYNRRRLISGLGPIAYKGEHRWDTRRWVKL